VAAHPYPAVALFPRSIALVMSSPRSGSCRRFLGSCDRPRFGREALLQRHRTRARRPLPGTASRHCCSIAFRRHCAQASNTSTMDARRRGRTSASTSKLMLPPTAGLTFVAGWNRLFALGTSIKEFESFRAPRNGNKPNKINNLKHSCPPLVKAPLHMEARPNMPLPNQSLSELQRSTMPATINHPMLNIG
jgi:hypothetical protein